MTDEPVEPANPVDPVETLRAQLAEANHRLIQAELKSHAIRAGIIDVDCLKLLDTSGLVLDASGDLIAAPAALAKLKLDKPWLFTKPNTSHPTPPPAPEPPKPRMARDMTFREWQTARERLLRGR
ncbi:hypothetical protein [Acidisphaera sp. L21]|uniref:hypothetical protein n=1 Tax=Acidisphaera sp. L21 TaxID=1641851 RepID=UPI00131C8EB5|nr:hypothetical protein [Acidisphaera sp. L21]